MERTNERTNDWIEHKLPISMQVWTIQAASVGPSENQMEKWQQKQHNERTEEKNGSSDCKCEASETWTKKNEYGENGRRNDTTTLLDFFCTEKSKRKTKTPRKLPTYCRDK